MFNKKLISYFNPKSAASESYRMIRTNMLFADIDKVKKIIAVTSAMPGEGKTTTVVNIAVTLANAGEKVLIIDCDLRKPMIHKMFQVSNETGLTDLLLKKDSKYVIQEIKDIDGLDILTSGQIPIMPAELLGSNSMKIILEEAKTHYDRIIIDTPPVLNVADADIISKYADGMILVVAYGEYSTAEIRAAKKSLEKVGATILGCIISKAEIGKKGYYYYRYGYYYGNQNKKGKKKKRLKIPQ